MQINKKPNLFPKDKKANKAIQTKKNKFII